MDTLDSVVEFVTHLDLDGDAILSRDRAEVLDSLARTLARARSIAAGNEFISSESSDHERGRTLRRSGRVRRTNAELTSSESSDDERESIDDDRDSTFHVQQPAAAITSATDTPTVIPRLIFTQSEWDGYDALLDDEYEKAMVDLQACKTVLLCSLYRAQMPPSERQNRRI